MKPLIVLLLLPLQLLSQDMSGIWTGFMHTRENDLSYELVISENNEKLSGYSLTIFTIGGIENVGIKKVRLKKKKGNISIEDDQLIYSNYTIPPKRVKLFSLLSLNVGDSILTLSGEFYTKSRDYRSSDNGSYAGTIILQRQKRFTETKLISRLDTMNLLNTISFIQPRMREKEKPVIAIAQEQTQPSLPEEKDSAILTTAEPLTFVLPKPEENQPDSISKKETAKNIDVPIVENKPEETTILLASVKEPAPEKEKQVDTISIKVAEENVQPVVETKTSSPQPVVIKTPEPPVIVNAAAAIAERKTEVIRSVFFRSDSLVLSLYDNGTVDGDTVSVVLNGKVIIAKNGLAETPIRLVVQIAPDLGDSLLLTMYAENLGAIAPNTGLLIIQDGNDWSEIRFEGDMQKNSAVILRRKR
jgi:hypothetical protein